MSQTFQVIRPTSPTTLIEFVLDETGSMSVCRDSTISGFNEYVGSQATQPGECVLTLTKFDSTGVRNVYTDSPINTVPPLNRDTYRPNATTNLYDAIGVRIRALEDRITKRTDTPSVLFVIMTDGQDNASREYTAASVKEMIKSKESQGWSFVFLGANQDAWVMGQAFGLSKGNTMTYDTANMAATMSNLSAATTTYRSMRASGLESVSKSATDFFGAINKDVK